jgi:ABC-type polysaccharide/polyol phosphate transport system ATPase subunit
MGDPGLIPTPLPVGAIRVDDVHKVFSINTKAAPRLGGWLFSKAFEYLRREPFEALRGVSFTVAPGEMVGLLGHNGAGKSTLLKMIAGITPPTRGRVEVNGRVTSLLELGIGFHPDLSGMENIFHSAALMGLGREAVMERLGRIIEFSGVGDFLSEPVKNYSSGMYSRLACAVALHLDPQVILMDEILAVGDAAFQARCMARVLDLHHEGVTILLVTHAVATARAVCDRLIWIDGGRVMADGDPRDVHDAYCHEMLRRVRGTGPFHGALAVPPRARLGAVRLVAPGRPPGIVHTGDAVRVEVEVEGEPGLEVCAGLEWRWRDGRLLASDLSTPLPLDADGRRLFIYTVPRWPLVDNEVTATPIVCDAERTAAWDRREGALHVRVLTPGFASVEFLVEPRTKWTIRPGGIDQ